MPRLNPSKSCPRCGKPTDAPEYKQARQDYTCNQCYRSVRKRSRLRNRKRELAYFRAYNRTRNHKAIYERNRQKIIARQRLREAVKRGVIKKLPCEVCGNRRSQGHHPDYSQPLKVVWLCHKHHMVEHYGEIPV